MIWRDLRDWSLIPRGRWVWRCVSCGAEDVVFNRVVHTEAPLPVLCPVCSGSLQVGSDYTVYGGLSVSLSSERGDAFKRYYRRLYSDRRVTDNDAKAMADTLFLNTGQRVEPEYVKRQFKRSY